MGISVGRTHPYGKAVKLPYILVIPAQPTLEIDVLLYRGKNNRQERGEGNHDTIIGGECRRARSYA